MAPIYINTDNSDKKNKIYIATKVGSAVVDAAESKMQDMVVAAFVKQPDFTTADVKNPKGYTLVFQVTEFSGSDNDATCKITGEILRYPPEKTKNKGTGAEKVMFSGDYSIKAAAQGSHAILQC